MTDVRSPNALHARMAEISASVSFARGCAVPLALASVGMGCPGPPVNRPLFDASRMLSPGVPRNRCRGLQQARLSHRCRTHSVSGVNERASKVVPVCNSYATWCVLRFLPRIFTCPYPSRNFDRSHGQQPSSSSDFPTCFQKSSGEFGRLPMRYVNRITQATVQAVQVRVA
jgi:hypothetical protein